MRPRFAVGLLLVTAAFLAGLAGRVGAQAPPPVAIGDTEFAAGDWIGSGTQDGTIGIPPPSRRMTGTVPVGTFGPYEIHRFTAATYDPSTQGAIAGVDYHETMLNFFTTEIAAVATAGALFQNGQVYITSELPFVGGPQGYRPRCLQPTDFGVPTTGQPVDRSRNPDFSASGAPIQFGYTRRPPRSLPAGRPSLPLEHLIDNWGFVVYPAPNPDCAGGPPSVEITKKDDGQGWGADPLIPYEITVSNTGGTAAPDLLVADAVPAGTTLDPGASTPGWDCPDGTGEGSLCTMAVGDLAPGASFGPVTFAVRLSPGTPTQFEVYNEAAVFGAPSSPAPPSPGAAADTEPGSFTVCQETILATRPILTCFSACTARVGDAVATICDSESSITEAAGFNEVDCCFATVIGWLICLRPPDVSTPPLDAAPADVDKHDASILYRLRDAVFRDTTGGQRATDLYYRHTAEMVRAAAADAQLIDLANQSLLDWLPVVQAVVGVEGAGDARVTQGQVDGLLAFLDALHPAAGPALQGAIDRGRERLQLESWVGLTPGEALARLDALVCTTEATLDSVRCRIGDVAEVVEMDVGKKLQRKLLRFLTRAAAQVQRAAKLAAKRKRRRQALKRANRFLVRLRKVVRSRRGRKIEASVREQLLAPVPQLQEDLRQLRRQR